MRTWVEVIGAVLVCWSVVAIVLCAALGQSPRKWLD